MKSSKKALMYVCITLVILVCIGAVQYARGEIFSSLSSEDKVIVSDLAALSGLSEDTVIKLYKVTESWPTIRDNIFVYKRILALVLEEMNESGEIFEIIKKYDPDNILSACEFLAKNGSDFIKLASILAAQADGQELEKIFAENMPVKEYAVYQPATEAQIENWLYNGYLPEDILAADQIALEKDLSIEEVLESKTDDNTWEEIAENYGSDLEEDAVKAQVSLTIQSEEGQEKFTAKDYKALVEQAKTRADKRKNEQKTKIAKETNISDAQLKVYEEEGFNEYEITNAYRLAEQSGANIKEVLDYKKKGTTWEETIKHFSGREKKAQP